MDLWLLILILFGHPVDGDDGGVTTNGGGIPSCPAGTCAEN